MYINLSSIVVTEILRAERTDIKQLCIIDNTKVNAQQTVHF